MRAVIYLRTSGAGQVEQQGPKVQEDLCRSYAASRGWTVAAVLHEAATTGTTDERPAYADALVMIERDQADVILLSSLDRLARTLTVQEALLRRAWDTGAEVHAANFGSVAMDDDEDPMRTAMRQMAGVFAQLDKSLTVARLRQARERAKAEGRKGEGRYPYGWLKPTHKGGEPVPHDDEQAVLDHLRLLIAAGMTWPQIVDDINGRGPRWYARTGRPWTRQNLSAVARRAGLTATPAT